MKTILVTGSRGFIGHKLCEQLIKSGLVVFGTRRSDQPEGNIWPEMIIDKNNGFEGENENIDLIFHLAGSYYPNQNIQQNNLMIDDNIKLTSQLIEFISNRKIPVIATGSYFQHFNNQKSAWSNYSIYKNASKNLLELMSETNKNLLRYIYLYDNYGINSKRKKFIDTIFNSIKNNQTISASPGNQKMNITCVEDVANCLVKSMETLQMSDLRREFQIKSNETLTLKEIVTEIEIGLEKKIDIEWGATSYRGKEVFQLWDCAEILPSVTFQETLCSYVKKNRKYFYESS